MKRFLEVFAVFAAVFLVISCSGGSKKDDVDTGDTVTDEDQADSDQTDTEPSEDTEPADTTSDDSDTDPASDDDADTIPEAGDDDADQAEPDDDEHVMKEAIYFGVIGFNKSQYIESIGLLDESTESSYKNFIDALNSDKGTGLYFADYTALKMMRDYQMPPNLKNVALVTFTDGLDNISLANDDYNPEHYGSQAKYRDAIHEMITSEEIHGLSVEAYTIGVKGGDVTDEAAFEETLKKLASSDGNVFQVSDMGEAMWYFKGIAQNLYTVSKAMNIDVKVPGGYDDGQVLRFTFDEPVSAADSNLYIEAVYRRTDDGRSLDEMTYHGLADGETTIGSSSPQGAFDHFLFEDLRYDDGKTSLSASDARKIMLWKKTSNGGWDRESEFNPETSTVITENRNSALIMLVLDCTTSLGADFARMKEAAKDFITILVNGNADIERVSKCTGLPENAQWNTSDEIIQSWSGSEWLPAAIGTYSEEEGESECRFKCEEGYSWNGFICAGNIPLGRICTGLTKCYNNSSEIECPAEGEGFYGQDAQYLDKCVSQHFTVETPVDGENVVLDHNTGLVWQQSPSENEYSWDDAPDHCNGLNSSNYGGINNWRVPNPLEFLTIVDNSKLNPATNSNFTNMPTGNSIYFWTSKEFKGDTRYAYAFRPYDGSSYIALSDSHLKTKTYKVLCVSGNEMLPATSADFTTQTISGSVVVIDSATGLMWQKEYVTDKNQWQQALEYCKNLNYAGYSDWRLPNKNEDASLVNYEKTETPYSYFPNMPNNWFLSSSNHIGSSTYVWSVFFQYGRVDEGTKNNNDAIRCVRNY